MKIFVSPKSQKYSAIAKESVFFSHTRMTPFSGTSVIYSYFIYITFLHKNL
jgi:hypothetical protein